MNWQTSLKLISAVTVFVLFSNESTFAGNDYDSLAPLLEEFREFRKPKTENGVPDFGAEAMAEQRKQIATFQRRLSEIDPTGWPVSEQIDYHLVRAEMNGMEFYHRVVRPWARDPATLFNAPFNSRIFLVNIEARWANTGFGTIHLFSRATASRIRIRESALR